MKILGTIRSDSQVRRENRIKKEAYHQVCDEFHISRYSPDDKWRMSDEEREKFDKRYQEVFKSMLR